ncbi:hypothetical protein D3C72_680310 [compost metagenome]
MLSTLLAIVIEMRSSSNAWPVMSKAALQTSCSGFSSERSIKKPRSALVTSSVSLTTRSRTSSTTRVVLIFSASSLSISSWRERLSISVAMPAFLSAMAACDANRVRNSRSSSANCTPSSLSRSR